MFFNNENEVAINNEFDYSNVIPLHENITKLVRLCSDTYNQFLKLIEEDEKKNERLKYEFKNYTYQKHFSQSFEIMVRQKKFEVNTYKNYESYIEAINSNRIVNVDRIEITMNLSFCRGKSDNRESHENSFKISFEPYDIRFVRKSNYKDAEMDQVENNINGLMRQFPTVNTIFYSK